MHYAVYIYIYPHELCIYYITVHSQRQLEDIDAVQSRENLMGGCKAWGRILCAVSLGSQSEEFLKPSEFLHVSQDMTLL